MIALTRIVTLGLAILAVAAIGAPAPPSAPDPAGRERALRGACYCRAAGTLQCTGGFTEAECRHRCDEALCDDWFWRERLPCWNWGYGG